MASEYPPASTAQLPDYLPGAQARTQQRYTFTLHTPAFASLPPLRKNIREKLEGWNIASTHIDILSFTATEIVTNLVKHPPVKASIVRITLRLEAQDLILDISDDSTPFASFVAECKRAHGRLGAGSPLRTHSYGLACLLEMHETLHYIPSHDSPDARNHLTVRMQGVQPHPRTADDDFSTTLQMTQETGKKLPLVYLMDDNPVTLSMYAQALENEYRVKTFGYAATALNAFPQDAPDLVIADISLPDMDGVSFRHHLCDLPGGRQTPFVFLGSHIGRSQETDASLTGIDDFLYKPVSTERLLSVTTRLIRRSSQIAASVHNSFDKKINGILYPDLPQTVHGWRIATRSSRAEAGGGDFILYHNEPDRIFGAVADVMGHGRDAKFFACAYAGYLRSFIQVLRPASGPGAFLEKLSSAIHADSFFDLSAMTCLVFELSAGRQATLATAGHPPPSLCTRNGTTVLTREIDVTGPLPGLVAASPYHEETVKLNHGDRLLIATDGYWNIAERRDPLHAALRETASMNIERAADLLWQAHIEHSSATARHQDDTTLIIIEAGET